MSYPYKELKSHPAILAFYMGWLGQRAACLMYSAVYYSDRSTWKAATHEVRRMLLLADIASPKRSEARNWPYAAAVDGVLQPIEIEDWWHTAAGEAEHSRNDPFCEFNEYIDDCSRSRLPVPRLAIHPQQPSYVFASEVLEAVGDLVTGVAVHLHQAEAARTGVEGHRWTPW